MKLIKKIDRIVHNEFFYGSGYRRGAVDRHNFLCILFCGYGEVECLWIDYWDQADIKHKGTINSYVRMDGCNPESLALLRLLIVEDFKEWVKSREGM